MIEPRHPADSWVKRPQEAASPQPPDPQESGAQPRRRYRRLRAIALTCVLLVVLPPTGAAAVLQIAGMGRPDVHARTRGRDALWLGHAWVDGHRTDADVRALAARARGSGIHDLYLHTGPLEPDGTLNPGRHPRAGWAIKALHAALPGVRVQAWLGQRVDPGYLQLNDPATRGHILAVAQKLLDLGFDGVHYDFEPTPDGDRGLLRLLDATRALTGSRHAIVSVAAAHVEPVPMMAAIGNPVVGHPKWWSPAYLRQVARRVDQVAIMSYDTALPFSSWYTGYLRMETETSLQVVPAFTQLLMGLPAYHTNNAGHHASAETVAAAVRGVRLGLGRSQRERFGVALYVDFAATDSDWSAYRQGWL